MFGEGILPICIIIILFFRKIYYGIVASVSLIVSTIIVQSLKRTIFSDVLRPKAYLKDVPDLYYIENIEIYSLHSFPSGHSSGAFTLFIVLAYFAKNKIVQVFYFVMAFMVTLSRVYMMQHFFIDTYFGAAIGVLISVIVIYYFENYSSLKNKPFADKPIYKLNS
ncbi:membrane-associated phospholipid phosphatase [Sporocytophaga myxococcoides]|uniref:Membrane-associated phospholipid phosphatase n=2 Tax=Sporocytophaga myxococcoides TaxID=153721 RepID=A0A098LD31_9BACT|nr:membrane-associated phospholipid phosphatase [Sporocytophaga myxococcoides]